jgi:hypothetical protein
MCEVIQPARYCAKIAGFCIFERLLNIQSCRFVKNTMSITRYFDPRTAEEMRLRHGIVRKSSIVRSVDYRRQLSEWKVQAAASGDLLDLRAAFEASFFSDSHCNWEQNEAFGKLCYELTGRAHTSETLFLLDTLKDKACSLGMQVFRAESWKSLDPEAGVEVHQRYLLRKKINPLVGWLVGRWIKSDLLVLEAIYMEQIRTRLEIRHYREGKRPCFDSLAALMAALLARH